MPFLNLWRLKMVRNQRDNGQINFTVTNWTNDVTLDCNANSDLATADVLGTLINALIEAGVINGSVSA